METRKLSEARVGLRVYHYVCYCVHTESEGSARNPANVYFEIPFKIRHVNCRE